MFILYALLCGLVAGFLLGGRPIGLARLQLRWVGLALGGLVVQTLLFSRAVGAVVGPAGPPIYVISTAAVLVFVLANIRVPGLPLVAAGSASNLAAIVANGGFMPTTEAALAAAGLEPVAGYSNSAVLPDPRLWPLTDIFALPPWLPLANVFSLGDLLIGVGLAVAIAAAMRLPDPDEEGGATLFARPRATIRPLVDPLARLAGHGGVLAVTPRSMISTNGALPVPPPQPTVGPSSDIRCSMSIPSRANPSQGGDAKPGIRGTRRETARLPGRRRRTHPGGVR